MTGQSPPTHGQGRPVIPEDVMDETIRELLESEPDEKRKILIGLIQDVAPDRLVDVLCLATAAVLKRSNRHHGKKESVT